MLLQLDQSLFLEKDDSKKDLVETFNSKYSKVIFLLLNEIIAIYVKLIFIYVRDSSFKKSLLGFIKIS